MHAHDKPFSSREQTFFITSARPFHHENKPFLSREQTFFVVIKKVETRLALREKAGEHAINCGRIVCLSRLPPQNGREEDWKKRLWAMRGRTIA